MLTIVTLTGPCKTQIMNSKVSKCKDLHFFSFSVNHGLYSTATPPPLLPRQNIWTLKPLSLISLKMHSSPLLSQVSWRHATLMLLSSRYERIFCVLLRMDWQFRLTNLSSFDRLCASLECVVVHSGLKWLCSFLV